MSSNKKIFFKKISYLTASQILSLLVSASLVIILPKFISIADYGYWQLFILYSGYVGLFHFGYSDGLYIKLGGNEIKKLDNKSLSEQFTLFVFIQFIFSVIILFFAINYSGIVFKKYVYIASAIYLFIENTYKLLSFLLLTTDNTIIYSKSVFIDKATILLFLSLLFLKIDSFVYIVIVYIFARFVALAYLSFELRYFLKFRINKENIKKQFNGILENCKLGIILTFSNILSTLIIASGRLFVEHFWGINYFAKISLAVSLSFFVVAFISQISLVLFPLLCNMDNDKKKIILHDGNIILGFFIMTAFGLYFVLYLFIKYWLTNYTESLTYLIYLFPMVLFESKVQILYITYCKSLNKLKELLLINLLIFLLSIILYYLSAKTQIIDYILITMFISLMLRSCILELLLFKHFQIKISNYLFIELIYSFLFIAAFKFFSINVFILYYLISCCILYFVYRKDIVRIHNYMKSI
jgi:O-antigen/teichoic acid export membrane protein